MRDLVPPLALPAPRVMPPSRTTSDGASKAAAPAVRGVAAPPTAAGTASPGVFCAISGLTARPVGGALRRPRRWHAHGGMPASGSGRSPGARPSDGSRRGLAALGMRAEVRFRAVLAAAGSGGRSLTVWGWPHHCGWLCRRPPLEWLAPGCLQGLSIPALADSTHSSGAARLRRSSVGVSLARRRRKVSLTEGCHALMSFPRGLCGSLGGRGYWVALVAVALASPTSRVRRLGSGFAGQLSPRAAAKSLEVAALRRSRLQRFYRVGADLCPGQRHSAPTQVLARLVSPGAARVADPGGYARAGLGPTWLLTRC